MTSPDLIHWTKHPANPVLVPVEPYYQVAPSDVLGHNWRDPCIVWFPGEGVFEAYLCARQHDYDPVHTGGTCVARLESTDLLQWRALPPLVEIGHRFLNAEVPDYFELGGWHYVVLNNCGLATRLNDCYRERANGSFYLMSQQRLGPYRLPEAHVLLGAGMDRIDSCCARTIPWNGGRLAYSFIPGGLSNDVSLRPSWAAPKVVRQHKDGTLWLGYWSGLERLETKTVVQSFEAVVSDPSLTGLGCWEIQPQRLTGRAAIPLSTVLLPYTLQDFHMTCRITALDCSRLAILVRLDQEQRRTLSVTLDYELGRLELGPAEKSWMPGLIRGVYDYVRGVLPPRGQECLLRIFVRDEYIEVYLNDRWFFPSWIPSHSRSGRVGFAVERGTATFSELRVAELEPLR